MDKKQFFALLTNEAAAPRPEFISALKAQVVEVAATGGAGGSGGILGSSGRLYSIAGAVVATGAIIAFSALSQPNQPFVNEADPSVVLEASDERIEESEPQETSTQDDDETVVASDESPPESSNETIQDSPSQPAITDQNPVVSDTPDEDPDPVIATPGPFTLEFWNHGKFAGLPVMQDRAADYTTTSQTLAYNWGGDSPSATISDNYFTMRATQIRDFGPGEYQLVFSVEDGIRVFIDGELVLDHWGDGVLSGKENIAIDTDLKDVELRVEFYEETDEAFISFDVIPL